MEEGILLMLNQVTTESTNPISALAGVIPSPTPRSRKATARLICQTFLSMRSGTI